MTQFSAGGVLFALTALFMYDQPVSAQDVSRYRQYVLESTLESVLASTGGRATQARTTHERPSKLQELEWRAPYVMSGAEGADPVRGIVFAFVDDALYQVVVTYDGDRTKGLKNEEIVETLAATYGPPVSRLAVVSPGRPAEASTESGVLARWDTATASLTVVRGTYSDQVQLTLVSKPLSVRARDAIREARRLDAVEAPRRESDQRKKDAAEASAARDKARTANKAAFRP